MGLMLNRLLYIAALDTATQNAHIPFLQVQKFPSKENMCNSE